MTVQEETIEHLRALLKEKVTDPGEMIHGFQDLMEKQSNQFQQFMDSIGRFIQESSL